MKIILLLFLLALLFNVDLFSQEVASTSIDHSKNNSKKKPNILFILADDLGREGIASYGGDLFDTPNIDRLGREGLMFTQAFSNPYCTPTRSEILTGRYPFATNTLLPIYDYERHKDMQLDVSHPTFAKQLQKVGYKTAIAGKWQLTFLAKNDIVHDFGFDTYMLWQILTDENERTTRFHNPHFRKDGRIIADEIKDRYGPDVMVDFLIDFMKKNHEEEKPFMTYYTSLLPHYPWVPNPDSEDQTVPTGSGIYKGIPKFYPGMVERLDFNVGRLLDSLEELGIAENTIVIFVADNGTDQNLYSSINGQTLLGGKGTSTDRATQVPLLIRWPDKIQPGSKNEDLLEVADFFPTLCEFAGAPLPEEFIHGQSFAAQIFGKNIDVEPRAWVHIEKADERYLRTKNWIVTDKGVYKKIQPYPVDAQSVDPKILDRSTRERLQGLEDKLAELKNEWPLNKNNSNISKE